MDADIARWVLEFLLLQPIDDRLLNAVFQMLPLSDADSKLKKRMLLKRIESEISNGSVSENLLDFLEHMEELDYEEGVEASGAMKEAYCAVAVDCTARFLIGNEKVGKFLKAVKSIWVHRVSEMESFEKVGLVSDELRNWKVEIAQCVQDPSVCQNVIERSKGNNAVEAVRVYVDEVKEMLGPSFIELAIEKLGVNPAKKLLHLGNRRVREEVRNGASSLPNAVTDLFASESTDEGTMLEISRPS